MMEKRLNYVIYAIIWGIIVGLLTVVGQKFLPGSFNSFANSGSVWLIPAFYVSRRYYQRKQAIFFSVIYLLVCVETYYTFYKLSWKTGFMFDFHEITWILCAIIFGYIFGLGGYLAKNGSDRMRVICMTMLPATFLAEGLSYFVHFKEYSHMAGTILMWIVISLILYAFNTKSDC